MKWSDIKGVFNTHTLKVISVIPFSNGYLSVDLDADGLVWRPGEHGIFTFPGKEFSGRKWHAFSIASTPEEGIIRIGTRLSSPPSGFKQTLLDLKPNDTVALRGPFGWYTLKDNNSPIVLIAGGTGITAARAVLSQAEKSSQRKIHLVHLSSNGHLYQSDLSKKKSTSVDLHFLHDRDVAARIIDDLAVEYGNNAYYYVSGPIEMNKQTIQRLKTMHIKRKRIVVDPYFGY
ncbi:MAG: FAD-dependent oxidoreductase [Eubacteriales bacterium]